MAGGGIGSRFMLTNPGILVLKLLLATTSSTGTSQAWREAAFPWLFALPCPVLLFHLPNIDGELINLFCSYFFPSFSSLFFSLLLLLLLSPLNSWIHINKISVDLWLLHQDCKFLHDMPCSMLHAPSLPSNEIALYLRLLQLIGTELFLYDLCPKYPNP